jgi:two-component system sensor histidine kinase/response regulator
VSLHLELKQKRCELERVNRHLEQMVEERTSELEKANKQLVKLDQAKNDFIGLISHEIRTPLTGIIGFADLLEKKLTSSSQLRYLGILRKSASRLEKFAETALLITSIKTDQYELKKKPLLLHMMLDEAIELFHEQTVDRNIHIATDVEPEDMLIVGDHDLLRMCFSIILENALNYSPQDDYVQIKARKAEGGLIIEICDRGPGIPDSIKGNLFELFVTEDVMHHNEGLGLGLPTAKMIMDLHEGRIEIGVCKEKGTVIRLFFAQLY